MHFACSAVAHPHAEKTPVHKTQEITARRKSPSVMQDTVRQKYHLLIQSLVMSKHSGEKEKRENVLFKQIPRSRAYESCFACQHLKRLFPNLVGSNPRTSSS